MDNVELDIFLSVHVPGKGYHAVDGEIELYTEKNLSFKCGCGENHPVSSANAIIDFPLENKGLYICPKDDRIFVLVKASGVFSVKGLKTIAYYKAENENTRNQILMSLESRKKRS